MTLLELLKLLKKKLHLVVILPLMFGAATAGVSWGILANEYTSSVSLYVLTTSSQSSSVITSSDTAASQQLANDIAALAKSNRVLSDTAKSLGMNSLSEYEVDVSSSTTNRIITLNVTGESPESVAIVADGLADNVASTAVEVMEVSAVNIIDEAQIPENPSGPDRLMYTLVAILAGLFVAIAWIVLIDMIDTSIKSEEEIEELFGLPVLGSMPTVKGK